MGEEVRRHADWCSCGVLCIGSRDLLLAGGGRGILTFVPAASQPEPKSSSCQGGLRKQRLHSLVATRDTMHSSPLGHVLTASRDTS